MNFFNGIHKNTSHRKVAFLLMFILVICIFFFGIRSCSWFQSGGSVRLNRELAQASKGLTQYNINVKFDPDAKIIQCIQQIDFINKYDEDFTKLYFHLYPNAFKHENKVPFEEGEMFRAYPNGFSRGQIEISTVKSNDNDMDYFIGGYSEDIMMLSLNEPVSPGESVEIEMIYEVKIPNCLGRFGYGDNNFNITNWYPILCGYDEHGWHLNPYYSIGDPFYSETSNYSVVIEAPEGFTIASTGDILSKDHGDDIITWHIEAKAVRDFAWFSSDKFQIEAKKVGHTTVYSYYIDETYGPKVLDYASNALKIYNRLFGEYPYNQYSVVQSDFFVGGMEYPNIVMIDGTLYNAESETWLEIITVHETAHQWWYGMVGNNQVDEAWLDEALTEYATVLYYGKRYNEEKENEIFNDIMGAGKYNYIRSLAENEEFDETINKPVYKFDNWIIYDVLVYGKGSVMIHEIRQKVGDETFFEILETYFQTYKYSNASGEGFISICEEVTGEDWKDFFDKWLN